MHRLAARMTTLRHTIAIRLGGRTTARRAGDDGSLTVENVVWIGAVILIAGAVVAVLKGWISKHTAGFGD